LADARARHNPSLSSEKHRNICPKKLKKGKDLIKQMEGYTLLYYHAAIMTHRKNTEERSDDFFGIYGGEILASSIR